MARRNRDVHFEDCMIVFKNFSGKEGAYNPAGVRRFSVLLNEEKADVMAQDGWNVKWLKAREEGEPDQAHLPVQIRFDNVPPKAILIADGVKTILDEDTIGMIDFADIEKVDLIVTPYAWEVNGKKGIKAYMRGIYVTIHVDEFESKYSNIPDSATRYMESDIDD